MDFKNLFLSLLLLFGTPLYLHASIGFEEVLQLGLNVLKIETENAEEPTCEYVSSPEGSMGKSITNATKIPGSLKIFSPDGEKLYDSGDYEKNESGMTIKIRGNTSAYSSKKPYKIKLQKKADLLFRDDKKYNDKNWVLLNDNHLRLYIGFEISRLLEEEWTPSGMYVNVIINDIYRGIYFLAESIERNEKSRINVSDDGFIVEHDAYWWNENGEYILSQNNPLLNYTFKYPDFVDISEDNLDKITESIQEYEISLKDDTYVNTIDMDSFAKWILGHDILGTWDGAGSNLFLSKYDLTPDSKIKAGPLWDFDTIELNENQWSGVHTGFNRFNSFFKSEDTQFMKVFLDLWKRKGGKVYEGILEIIEDLRNSEEWEAYRLSSEATSKFWGNANDAYEAANRDESWFMARFEWLKQQLGHFDENSNEEAGIAEITNSPRPKSSDVYNLQGLKVVSNAQKDDLRNLSSGIYIMDGKKVIVK